MMDGTYTAVIDRIVDGQTAVILIQADGEAIEEYTVAAREVPTNADAGSVLEVRIEDGELVEMASLKEQTESRRHAAQNRFDRLSKRLPDSSDHEK